MEINQITEKIIGSAIEVHKELGCGFLESVYQSTLAREMNLSGLTYRKEYEMPVEYKGVKLGVGFRCDFFVEDKVIVECKAVKELSSIDEAQLLNYLKIKNLQVGLIINFNSLKIKDGIKRMVNNYQELPASSAPSAVKANE